MAKDGTKDAQPAPEAAPLQAPPAAPRNAEVERLTAELADRDRQLAQRDEKLQDLRSRNSQLIEERGADQGTYPIERRTTTTKPTYEFRIAMKGKNVSELPVKVYRAIDESETIRLYALDYGKNGKPLDTVGCRPFVECLEEEKRQDFADQVRAKRNAARRRPLEAATTVG